MENKKTDQTVFEMTPFEFKQLNRKDRKKHLIGRTKEELQKLCRNMNVSDQGHRIELGNRLIYL